jgi:hypothetical protein
VMSSFTVSALQALFIDLILPSAERAAPNCAIFQFPIALYQFAIKSFGYA